MQRKCKKKIHVRREKHLQNLFLKHSNGVYETILNERLIQRIGVLRCNQTGVHAVKRIAGNVTFVYKMD